LQDAVKKLQAAELEGRIAYEDYLANLRVEQGRPGKAHSRRTA
jgi:hypothetical protein